MAKVIFTAWKTKAQLVEVRNEFYPPPSYAGPDLRSHGCAVVCDIKSLLVQQSFADHVCTRSKLGSCAAMYRTMLKLPHC